MINLKEEQYNGGFLPNILMWTQVPNFLKQNLNASRPSEHPPVRGENVKTFGWDHRLQI